MRLNIALLSICSLLTLFPAHGALSLSGETSLNLPKDANGPAKSALEAFKSGDHAKAVEIARKHADQGDAEALYLLGFAHETGQGAEASREKAVEYYRKASAAGQKDAAYRLSFLFLASESEEERKEAKAALEKAAQDDPEVAGRILGEAYLRGSFSEKPDFENAVSWWTRAAEAGDVPSLLLLARLYEGQFGFAEKKDVKKAMAAYEKAAGTGDAGAMVTLASRFFNGEESVRDEKKGREWIEKAIKLKEPSAYFVLGDFEENVKNDPKAALAAYERGKDAGQVDCTLRAAGFYLQGKGVEKDAERGLDLLATAAKGGSPLAHFQLAVHHLSSAEEPDLLTGYGHLLTAATGGLVEAQNELGLFYLSGKLAVADPAAAVAWLTKAAQGGYPQAQNNLAALYERGAGVPQNLGNAGQLYSLAANQGHGPATFAIARLLAQGLGTKADPAKAWAYATFAGERGEKQGAELADNLFAKFDEKQKAEARRHLEDLKSGKASEETKGE